MEENEKIELIDKILNGLNTSELDTVLELIDGFRKYPVIKSELDSKYRIIEQELLDLKVAEIIGGGGNKSINGYYHFKITPNGLNLILEQKSVSELYKNEQIKLAKKLK